MKKNSSRKKAVNIDASKIKQKTPSQHPFKKYSLDSDLKVLGAMLFLICLVYVFTYVDFSSMMSPEPKTCENLCGDGNCQEVVCLSVGCPCAETAESCPKDCPKWVRADNNPEIPEATKDWEANETAGEYVHHLYCFNNYNSSNLQQLKFEKISDENRGTYHMVYQFDINTERLAGVKAMSADLVVSNGVVTSAKISRVTENIDSFCGYSTNGPCETNVDCVTGGCSGQICRSASEESTMTTCEWRDCYAAEKYNLSCKCLSGQCVWN